LAVAEGTGVLVSISLWYPGLKILEKLSSNRKQHHVPVEAEVNGQSNSFITTNGNCARVSCKK